MLFFSPLPEVLLFLVMAEEIEGDFVLTRASYLSYTHLRDLLRMVGNLKV